MNNIPLGRNPIFVKRERETAARAAQPINEMALEDVNSVEDKSNRKIMLAWCCLLSYFIFWYDDPKVPAWLMAIFGGVFLVFVLKQARSNIHLIFYIFTVYVSFQKVLAGDFGGKLPMFNLTNILLGIIVWSWLSKPKVRGTGIYKFSFVDIFLMVYVTFLMVSMLRTEFQGWETFSPRVVITHFKRLVEPFFVYFLFTRNIQSRKQIAHILFGCCIVIGAVGVMGVKQYYMDIGAGSFNSMSKNQITILTEQPNQLATYLGTYAFFPLAVFYYNRKKWWGWACLLMFLFCLQAVRVTFSRGGLLSFLAGLALVLVVLMRWKVLLLIPFILMIISVYPQKVLGPRLYKNYMIYMNSQNNILPEPGKQQKDIALDASAASRWTIMQAGIKRVGMEPLAMFFGVGLGKFPPEVNKVDDPKVGHVDAHNQWLLIFVEAGVIALVAIWLILGILFMKAGYVYWKTKDPIFKALCVGFMGGLLAMFLGNFVGSRMNSNEVTLLFWIMAGCVMKLRSIELNEAKIFIDPSSDQ